MLAKARWLHQELSHVVRPRVHVGRGPEVPDLVRLEARVPGVHPHAGRVNHRDTAILQQLTRQGRGAAVAVEPATDGLLPAARALGSSLALPLRRLAGALARGQLGGGPRRSGLLVQGPPRGLLGGGVPLKVENGRENAISAPNRPVCNERNEG